MGRKKNDKYTSEFIADVLKYVAERMNESYRSIGTRFGVHHQTVAAWIKKKGVRSLGRSAALNDLEVHMLVQYVDLLGERGIPCTGRVIRKIVRNAKVNTHDSWFLLDSTTLRTGLASFTFLFSIGIGIVLRPPRRTGGQRSTQIYEAIWQALVTRFSTSAPGDQKQVIGIRRQSLSYAS